MNGEIVDGRVGSQAVPALAKQGAVAAEDHEAAAGQLKLLEHSIHRGAPLADLAGLGGEHPGHRHHIVAQLIVQHGDVDLRLQQQEHAAEDQKNDRERSAEPEDQPVAESHGS